MFEIEKIIGWIKKNITRTDVLIVLGLGIVYFISRLINLEQLPIFNDEGIYIHWAKLAWRDASWRFVSLTDGKQPLQTWGTIPLVKLFPEQMLFGGRLFSVLTGFFGLSGMVTLTWYLWGKRAGFISGLLYIITPYFLFYDRMAMVDSGVNAFSIWILFFSILLVRTIRLDTAIIYGLLMGVGLLAKSSVRMFTALSLLSPLLIWNTKEKRNSKILNFGLLFFLTVGIAFILYNIQRLSPFFHFVAQKNNTFVMTFSEWLTKPFEVVFSNLQTIPKYVLSEMGYLGFFVGLFGLFKLFKKDRPLAHYFLAWILLPYLFISLFTKVLFPRYIIFFGSLFIILSTYAISHMTKKTHRIGLIALFTAVFLLFAVPMWFDYTKIPFPLVDRGQYVEGATVGYGIKEIMEYARNESQRKRVILLAEGDFGLSGDMLDVYKRETDNIFIKGLWPLNRENVIEAQKELPEASVFIVLAHQQSVPSDWPVEIIETYPKYNNNAVIYLLKLLPE